MFLEKERTMDILIDFDGTVVTHDFPNVGKDIGAVAVLKELVKRNHNLILFTMRSEVSLQEAVDWFTRNEIPLYGIQTNPTQRSWTSSPKAYGQLMIDDIALGCPLAFDPSLSGRPFVDWKEVKKILLERRIL
jgi:hypothetical protein